jgi:hypothetical protein
MKLFPFLLFVFFFIFPLRSGFFFRRKRNIIKPHLLMSIYGAAINESAINIEFERGLNKRNSMSAQVASFYLKGNYGQVWNENFVFLQYRHYMKSKKDIALRGFYLGAELFHFIIIIPGCRNL